MSGILFGASMQGVSPEARTMLSAPAGNESEILSSFANVPNHLAEPHRRCKREITDLLDVGVLDCANVTATLALDAQSKRIFD